jgi:lipoprotein-anchoring transpeptidase ErfK/SrfK
MQRTIGVAAVLLTAAAPAAAADTGPSQPTPTPIATPAPEPARPRLSRTSLIARIDEPTRAYATPGARHARRVLSAQASWGLGPVGLMVTGEFEAPDGRRWLRVRLPGRPNGLSAWVQRSQVRTVRTRWSIEIRLGARTLTLRRFGRTYRRWRAVVGAPLTPTPTGLFAVSERNREPNPGGFYGPWILRLTARSEALKRFDGGPGTVGIHGRGGASLLDPLGSARSHGCVRVSNDVVNTLARVARAGTPILISR